MNYLESIADYLKKKLGFGEKRRSAPPMMFREPHQPLTTIKPARRSIRRVTQYSVSCQTEEMEPESFKLNASELLFDNSNISEDPNNTAPQIDTDKLVTQSKQQPDEVLKEHNRFERLCTLNNGCENS